MAKQKEAATLKAQQRQKDTLKALKKKEVWMKWLIVGALILILFLLLLLGYATDWTKGLRKDSANSTSTPLATSLDSANGTDTTSGTGTATGSDTSSTDSDASTTTDKSSTSTSTTTTNNTTTNNNTETQPSGGLLSLYSDSSAGDDIDNILNEANQLGITPDCHTEVLVQICDFTIGNDTVTVRSLAGTVTGVTKNF